MKRGKLIRVHKSTMRIHKGVIMPYMGHGFGLSMRIATPDKHDNIKKLKKSFAHLSINEPKKTKPRYISF